MIERSVEDDSLDLDQLRLLEEPDFGQYHPEGDRIIQVGCV